MTATKKRSKTTKAPATPPHEEDSVSIETEGPLTKAMSACFALIPGIKTVGTQTCPNDAVVQITDPVRGQYWTVPIHIFLSGLGAITLHELADRQNLILTQDSKLLELGDFRTGSVFQMLKSVFGNNDEPDIADCVNGINRCVAMSRDADITYVELPTGLIC